MALSRTKAVIAAGLAAATLAGTAGQSVAAQRYGRHPYYGYNRYHHGIGPGAAIAGAALGIAGVAAAGIAANSYYNGYPSYTYGPGYGPRYGYDYVPDHGYYGPY